MRRNGTPKDVYNPRPLKLARKFALGLRVDQAAELLGVSRATVYSIERGLAGHVSVAKALRAYGIDPKDIYPVLEELEDE